MQVLRSSAQTKARGLLHVLLLRFGQMPADPAASILLRGFSRRVLPVKLTLYNEKMDTTFLLKTGLLFLITALAEIAGCFLPYLWLRHDRSAWLLVPAAVSLALFAWLLTLHPAASGQIYAAYGGVYIATALVWLQVVDGVKLTTMDWVGAAIVLIGVAILVSGWRA